MSNKQGSGARRALEMLATSQERSPDSFLLAAGLLMAICLVAAVTVEFDPQLAVLGSGDWASHGPAANLESADSLNPPARHLEAESRRLTVLVETRPDYLGLLGLFDIANSLQRIPGVESTRPPVSRQILDLGPVEAMNQLPYLEAISGKPVFVRDDGGGASRSSDARTYARIGVVLLQYADKEGTVAWIRQILEASGFAFSLQGQAITESRLASRNPVPLSFATVLAAFLAFGFRRFGSLRTAAIAAGPGIFGALLSLGAAGLAGARLDLASLAAPALIVALGWIPAFGAVRAVAQLRRGGSSLERAVSDGLARGARATLAWQIAVLAGALALQVFASPGIKSFAVFVFFGQLGAALAHWVLLPPVLFRVPLRQRAVPASARRPATPNKRIPTIAEALTIVAAATAGFVISAGAGPAALSPGEPAELAFIISPPPGDPLSAAAALPVLEFQDRLAAANPEILSASLYSAVRGGYAQILGQPQYPRSAASQDLVLGRIVEADFALVESFFADDELRGAVFVQVADSAALELISRTAAAVNAEFGGTRIVPVHPAFALHAHSRQVQHSLPLWILLVTVSGGAAIVVASSTNRRRLPAQALALLAFVFVVCGVSGLIGLAGAPLGPTAIPAVFAAAALALGSILRQDIREVPVAAAAALGLASLPVLLLGLQVHAALVFGAGAAALLIALLAFGVLGNIGAGHSRLSPGAGRA